TSRASPRHSRQRMPRPCWATALRSISTQVLREPPIPTPSNSSARRSSTRPTSSTPTASCALCATASSPTTRSCGLSEPSDAPDLLHPHGGYRRRHLLHLLVPHLEALDALPALPEGA